MGRNLSLLERRLRARGFNARQIKFIGGRTTLRPSPVAATVTLLTTNAAVKYTTQAWRGAAGNSIRVRYVVAGNNTALSVSVSGLDITVNVATNGSAAATSTATQVAAAVNASGAARDLVEATLPGTGATVVSAVGFTNLAGGTG